MLALFEEYTAALKEMRSKADDKAKDCADIGLNRPDFGELEDLAAEIEEARGSWARLGTFKQELQEARGRG